MKVKLLVLAACGALLAGVFVLERQTVLPQAEQAAEKRPSAPAGQQADAGLQAYPIPLLDGSTVALRELPEPVILLNFWASWCAPCLEEFPAMLALVEEYEGELALLAVSVDGTQQEAERFLAKLATLSKAEVKGPGRYWAWDAGKVLSLRHFNTLRVPETIIFDKQRQMVKKVVGATDWQGEAMRQFLQRLVKKEGH